MTEVNWEIMPNLISKPGPWLPVSLMSLRYALLGIPYGLLKSLPIILPNDFLTCRELNS
jgi:hypothetical protein